MDHFTSTCANDMNAKNLIGFSIRQNFHETIEVRIRSCATIGCKGEFA